MFRFLLLQSTWMPDGASVPGAGGGASVSAGGGAVPFAEQLPADIRGEAAFKDIADLGTLAKSYLSAQKMIGVPKEKLLVLPDEGDAKGWGDVFARLGRPEAPDKYGLTAPQGVKVDPEFQTAFLKQAHESGLSTKQAKGLFDWYNTTAVNVTKAQETARNAAETQAIAGLKTEWGTAFDEKLGDAKAALQHYGDADLVKYLDDTRLGNDPRMLRAFAKLGAQLREDGVLVGRNTGAGGKSPAEAQQEIASLQNDKTFMEQYTNGRAAGHKEAVARMTSLYAMAHPG